MMKNSARAWPAAVLLALGLMTSGCAIDTSASADTPSRAEIKKQRKAAKERRERRDRADDRKGTAQQGKGSAPKPKPKPEPKPEPVQVWTCSWAPTVDQDPHNDVLCSNDIASERPLLRLWDEDVTKAEIMESARVYARQRTAG